MLDTKYLEHKVFDEINKYSSFYEDLSDSVFSFYPLGTSSLFNIDSYLFTSIKGTLESIHDILKKGHINDSYALLRKYHDSAIINVYSNLFLNDNFSLENLRVVKIDDWIKGKEKLPDFKSMMKYITSSAKLVKINRLIEKDDLYKNLRSRCNDHTHYNIYYYLLLNDNEVYIKNRSEVLDVFLKDLRDIFILHFSYLFYINNHYMASSDYGDSFDLGLEPEEGSQYYVAPFIQNMFDDVIKKYRIDLAEEIKTNSCMLLE